MTTSPVKADATGADVPFTFDGETYYTTPPAKWSLDAIEAFEADKVATCVRLLLGDDQWKRFKSKPRTIGDLNDMFQALQSAAVGSSGN